MGIARGAVGRERAYLRRKRLSAAPMMREVVVAPCWEGFGNWRNYRVCDKMSPTVIEIMLARLMIVDGDAWNFVFGMRLCQLTMQGEDLGKSREAMTENGVARSPWNVLKLHRSPSISPRLIFVDATKWKACIFPSSFQC